MRRVQVVTPALALVGPSVLYLLLVTAGLVRRHLAARRAIDRAARQLLARAEAECRFAVYLKETGR